MQTCRCGRARLLRRRRACRELAALAREAVFYGLPALVECIADARLVPQPGTVSQYDCLYHETGWHCLQTPRGLRELEADKVAVMQRVNDELHARGIDGFFVDSFRCRAEERPAPGGQDSSRGGSAGGPATKLCYTVLLKRVVPHLPAALLGQMGEDEEGEDAPSDDAAPDGDGG